MIGTQVLKIMNALYQQKKLYILYTNFLNFNKNGGDNPVRVGTSTEYPYEVKSANSYRFYKSTGYHHLRTMMTDIFLLTNITSYKDKNGEIYWTICDNAYFFPAMEMACGKVSYLPELKYWYTASTGTVSYTHLTLPTILLV